MKINEIIKYWTLCELSDFISFQLNDKNMKIKKYSYLSEIEKSINKKISDEYEDKKNGIPQQKKIKKDKKTNIYKVYLGFIKVEDFLKFLYQKVAPNIIKKYENELERINLQEYTYLGYVYLDYQGKLISIENKAMMINPIFYILKNINEQCMLNNFNYNNYIEDINEEFTNKYSINKENPNIIIPSFNYLMTSNINPFKFFQNKNSKILIHAKVFEYLKKLANDNTSKYYDKSLSYYEYLNNVKNQEIVADSIVFMKSSNEYINMDIEDYILEESIKLAFFNSSNFFYYLSNKENRLDKNKSIPINLYIYEFLNKSDLLSTSLKSSSNKELLNFNKIQSELLNELEIPEYLLYKTEEEKTSIFIGLDLKGYSLKRLKNLEKNMISFYVDALSEEPKKLTIDYIRGKTNRIDVNESISNRKTINDLKYFKSTSGKWASKYPLYYAQQAAVNLFLSNYNEEGNIFSVNGPPGTGKTTLLKDVIANIIIKRVQNILSLDCKVFKGDELNDDLVSKFEIIVTSNNNAAVENITVDLPKIDEFDFEYLGCTKDVLLLSDFAEEFYEYKSWNLFSLKLGKKDNVDKFSDNFENIIKKIKKIDKLTNESFLINRLNELKKQFYTISKYIKDDENEFESFDRLPKLLKSIDSLTNEIRILDNKLEFLDKEIKTILLLKEQKEKENDEIREKEQILIKRLELKKENLNSISFFSRYIFKRKVFNQLKDEIYQLNEDFEDILNKKTMKKEKLLEIKQELSIKNEEVENIQQIFIKTENTRLELESKYNELLDKYKNKKYYLPNDEYFNFSEDKIQKDKQVYGKEAYLKNKSLLFLTSLQISEVVFLLNINKFVNSINRYLGSYRRDNLLNKDLKKLQKDFSSLFFIFPVVSTTLASSYSMLKNIKSYGTLICDESGQATPQSLVGALNRANNALIVGDPLQVEPVFTVPEIVINIYNDAFNINPLYSPITSSAQQLADNANKFGSYYEVQNKKVWVGMPLVVHRRCLEPMFTIANKISYNEKMISATSYNDRLIEQLPNSCWIDVVSDDQDFNINSSNKEKKIMEQFINKYRQLLNDNYYIISPFKSINRMFNNNQNFEKISGTVHTFQGKEADVVFIILGGRTQGSKAWAAQKANILNVALTRAKKKVYIIGDYEKWENLNYFDVATKILPRIKCK